MKYDEFLILKHGGKSVLHKAEFWAVTFACGRQMACGKKIEYRVGQKNIVLKNKEGQNIAETPEFEYIVGFDGLLNKNNYDSLCPECFPNGLEEQG